MENTNFENLEIYQLAEKLSDEIWQIVSVWNNLAVDTIGKQVIRSADGIGANIAEGSGRGHQLIIEDFCEWLEALYMKHGIGCGGQR